MTDEAAANMRLAVQEIADGKGCEARRLFNELHSELAGPAERGLTLN